MSKSVFDYSVRRVSGEVIPLSHYRGRVLAFGNVAGFCGFTAAKMPMFSSIATKFAADPFTLLAFPCNQFANQEPRKACDVADWAQKDFHAPFEVFDAVTCKGPKKDPVYACLTSACGEVTWNFTLYLCHPTTGVPTHRFLAATSTEGMVEVAVRDLLLKR